MADQKKEVLFITDRKFVDYEIPGGVQICTAEFIEYFELAGFNVNIFKVSTSATLSMRLKAKIGIEAYEIYNVDRCLADIVNIIRSKKIEFVLFNQLNLSYWTIKIKKLVDPRVKFIGLSHGNESGDYLHEITKTDQTGILQTFRLGKMMVKEKTLFSKLLNGVITISDNETHINQWLGAESILFLPRILKKKPIGWKPHAKTIGFVGTLDHLPNFGGIDRLSENLQEKGFDGTLKIVGSPKKPGWDLENKYKFIKYCGMLDNEQLLNEVSSWSVFINPVFWYARGSSTKLSQAINWGMPVLTTPAGARGYELCNNCIITSDNTPAVFADAIIKTFTSPELLQQLKSASDENIVCFDLTGWGDKLALYLDSVSN